MKDPVAISIHFHSKPIAVKYCLLVGKDYTVGRRDTSILIADDQTVSRRHAVLKVSHLETSLTHTYKLPLLVLKDESKFGTWVNDAKLPTKGETALKDGDEMKFGSPKSSFMCVYEPLVVTTSCLEMAAKKDVKTLVCKLGGHVITEWRKECSLLLMSNLSVTVKVISALVSQKPVVTPEYLTKLQEALEAGRDQPDPLKYLPLLVEPHLNPQDVSFGPDPGRKTLFKGKKFIFLHPKQFKKLNMAVELAGGTPMLMEEGTDDNDDDIVVATYTVVMSADPAEPTLSQNAKDWIKEVQGLLRRHNKRMIPDAEIGYAILFCSTENHCNPDINPALATCVALPSQSLSERPSFSQDPEILVQDGESSRTTTKAPGWVGKGGKQYQQTVQDPEETSPKRATSDQDRDVECSNAKTVGKISVKAEPMTPVKGNNCGSSRGREIVIAEEPTESAVLRLNTCPRKSARKRGWEPVDDEIETEPKRLLEEDEPTKKVKTEKLSQETTRKKTLIGGNFQADGSSSDDMGPPKSRPRSSKRDKVLVEDTELDSLFQTSKRRNNSGLERIDWVSDSDQESKPVGKRGVIVAQSESSSDDGGRRGQSSREATDRNSGKTSSNRTGNLKSDSSEKMKTEQTDSYLAVPEAGNNSNSDSKPVAAASPRRNKQQQKSKLTISERNEHLIQESPQSKFQMSRRGNARDSSRSPSPARKSPRGQKRDQVSPCRDYEGQQERRVKQSKRPVNEDVEYSSGNLEQERPALLDDEVPNGFLTTRIPIGDQVDVNEDFEKEEMEDGTLVVTEFKSLVVRLPRGKQPSRNVTDMDGYVMWKGRKVKNFKKFKKSEHVGCGMLPRIIGGRDLEIHTNAYKKEIDDWYKEAIQAESQQNEEDRMASQLFDWDASSKGKTKRSR